MCQFSQTDNVAVVTTLSLPLLLSHCRSDAATSVPPVCCWILFV